MNQAITITSKSTAEQLNKIQVRNYDPRETLEGEYEITLTNPALYGLGVSSSPEDSSRLTMFASERVLSREWNTAEEDEAWAHL